MCRPSIRYQRVRLGFPKEEPPLAFCYTSTIHVARHIGNFNRRLDFTVVDAERNWSMTIVEEKLNSIYVSMLLFFMVLLYLDVIPTLTGANQYQSV
ncbi:hypothetical protein HanRHA438_Chr05g0226011 [Helianthus annuus]|uniref:Uncharacterized protein n=1 Tax=Helianthus annuus TaxID=4232 RepID=A0A251URA1_HELAN|nr:hypothetical protein HanXRQr2_Chr05g0216811 [Helianthus annuus]KAJ0584715.1 hypothetical protein HanHA89_Chr05g0191971 [Helianthus annuus]KAJ0750383.1 hypothetical protein HanLR1_Chr05g0181411 [Helianthus annuus]KAJ0919120.1 hypothetical protein HanRHA438_Chr05g0226011 [Helianthus annuus]KAJ0922909.1 hypothetical protein HanPSC8_Chr05g0209441 [Helianthus annuus]